jgi:hypothetical protein
MVKSDEHMERIRTKLVDEAYVPSSLHLHDTDNTDKESRSPKLPNDSEISRNTENRFKFKRSNRGRWTRNLSRTRSRVSRGVRSIYYLINDFADETERSEGAELGDEFDIDIDNSEDKPQRGGASARGARGRGGKTSVSPSVQPPLPSFQLPHTHDLLLTFASPSLSIFGYPYHRTIISSCPLHLLPFFSTP